MTSFEDLNLMSRLNELRNLVENAYTDVFVENMALSDDGNGSNRIILYSDPGGIYVDAEYGRWRFENYDEMLKAPVFWEHRLEEVIQHLYAHY